MFEEITAFEHGFESRVINKMVVHTIFFTRAHGARGVGDGHTHFRIGLYQRGNQTGFSGAGRSRNGVESAMTVHVTYLDCAKTVAEKGTIMAQPDHCGHRRMTTACVNNASLILMEFRPMSESLISPEEAAIRLRVRPAYVEELVKKGRLKFVDNRQLVASEVDKLAELMNKLRNQGIATLVDITAQNAAKKR